MSEREKKADKLIQEALAAPKKVRAQYWLNYSPSEKMAAELDHHLGRDHTDNYNGVTSRIAPQPEDIGKHLAELTGGRCKGGKWKESYFMGFPNKKSVHDAHDYLKTFDPDSTILHQFQK